jgi:[glutamine synthetase] adenylyltransferase / [glutamine synthetase]-adenylyl-L-tyrosine phosphorylase
VIAEFRYRLDGIIEVAAREIRRIKARMEAESIPCGADRALHVKLGPGGLSDVEWTVQLLQLWYAHALPSLRTSRTGGAGPIGRRSWPLPLPRRARRGCGNGTR